LRWSSTKFFPFFYNDNLFISVITKLFIWFFLFFILNRLYYKIINYYFKNKKKEKHSLFSPLPPQQVEVVRGERRKKEKIK